MRESKIVLDSGFHADSGFQSLSLELGFWIPVASAIMDSLSCIPDSKIQEYGFYMQIFPGFRIPETKISRIPDSTSTNLRNPESGIRIPDSLTWGD